MDWKRLLDSKFYPAGLIKFDDASDQFKDARDIGLNHVPAMYNLKRLLNISGDARPIDGFLLHQFDAAVSLVLANERNFLLDKFKAAVTQLKLSSSNTPTDGFVIVSPANTSVDFVGTNLFVYVVSDNDQDCYYFSNKVKNRLPDDTCNYIYYIFTGVTTNE
jgi:hypothetical protein